MLGAGAAAGSLTGVGVGAAAGTAGSTAVGAVVSAGAGGAVSGETGVAGVAVGCWLFSGCIIIKAPYLLFRSLA